MANENTTNASETSKANGVRVVFRGLNGSPEVELSKGHGLYSDGSIDVDTAAATIMTFLTSYKARESADQETGDADLTALLSLKRHRAVRNAPIGWFVTEIMTMRQARASRAFIVENPDASDDEVTEAIGKAPGCSSEDRERLTVVLGGLFRSDPERFHMGKRDGVSIRYVPGEVATDKEGKPLTDAEGNPAQAYRWSHEDWAKKSADKGDAATA